MLEWYIHISWDSCSLSMFFLGTWAINWCERIQEKILSSCFSCLERKLIPFILKLFAFVRGLSFEYWRKQTNVFPTNALEERQESSSSINDEAVQRAGEIHPCMQRLHKLENLLEEINKKPAEIPAEKDRMLHQSLNRIKSVEVDLEKTKRVRLISVACKTFFTKNISLQKKVSKSLSLAVFSYYVLHVL